MKAKHVLKCTTAAVALALSVMAGQASATTYTAQSIASNVRDMSGSSFVVSGDDNTSQISLPFQFSFYGQTFSTAFVSTNGFLSFNVNNQGCCDGLMMGSSALTGATIAAAWTDWIDTTTSKTVGNVGSREFILDWNGLEFPNQNPGHFQAILHEGTNAIEFQYGQTSTSSHTISAGIQDPGFGLGVSTAFGSNLNLTGQAVSISAVPEPETYALMLAGLGLVGFAARRKRVAKA